MRKIVLVGIEASARRLYKEFDYTQVRWYIYRYTAKYVYGFTLRTAIVAVEVYTCQDVVAEPDLMRSDTSDSGDPSSKIASASHPGWILYLSSKCIVSGYVAFVTVAVR